MSAMFDLVPELRESFAGHTSLALIGTAYSPTEAPITSTAEKPDLQIEVQPSSMARSDTPIKPWNLSPHTRPLTDVPSSERLNFEGSGGSAKSPMHTDSATESEGDEHPSPGKNKVSADPSVRQSSTKPYDPSSRSSPANLRPPSPLPPTSKPSSSKGPLSDSESSPARPAKKLKPVVSSSDEDNEGERKKRVAQVKGGAGGGSSGVKRGTRQPIKRGGKRF